MRRIFIVDDDIDIRQLIKKYLVKEGFSVTDFSDSKRVITEISRLKPDLIVLDIMMPGTDGIELCREIRKTSEIPIIFVTARNDEVDRIIGLEMGGDDYLSKPFSPRELVARIKNILKRTIQDEEKRQDKLLSFSDIIMDVHAHRTTVNDMDISLTLKEWETLKYLLNNPEIVLSRIQILEKVWGYDSFIENRIVDDVVKRLRKKLKDSGSRSRITTIWGVGYKIETEKI